MGEADDRTESDGKGLFIIRNGQKIAQYEAGKWVPLLPGVVVRITPDGIKIEWPHWAFFHPIGSETLRHPNSFQIILHCGVWGHETTRGLPSQGYRICG